MGNDFCKLIQEANISSGLLNQKVENSSSMFIPFEYIWIILGHRKFQGFRHFI